ncbi:hypothetical protein ACA910_004070 [Epithemia clementina (nom. ined.)]
MSLTPPSRKQEATDDAVREGLISGGMVLVPTLGSLYIAMQNKVFLACTNWQSRTAMAIMPALFAFAFTAEMQLHYKMTEIAQETQHSTDTVKWAERHHQQALQNYASGVENQQQQQQQQQQVLLPSQPQLQPQKPPLTVAEKEMHLMSLYKRSVEESGVNIVPGNELGVHHRLANFISANPIKSLAVVAVPSVALILYGRSGKEHLQMSIKILHTRVFGQFTTLVLLLSIMGFKDYMNRNGKFITEEEAERRVQEMKLIRQQLSDRLDYEYSVRKDQERSVTQAHEEDERLNSASNSSGQESKKKSSPKQQQHQQKKQRGLEAVANNDDKNDVASSVSVATVTASSTP